MPSRSSCSSSSGNIHTRSLMFLPDVYSASSQSTVTSRLPFEAVSPGWMKGYGTMPSLVYFEYGLFSGKSVGLVGAYMPLFPR